MPFYIESSFFSHWSRTHRLAIFCLNALKSQEFSMFVCFIRICSLCSLPLILLQSSLVMVVALLLFFVHTHFGVLLKIEDFFFIVRRSQSQSWELLGLIEWAVYSVIQSLTVVFVCFILPSLPFQEVRLLAAILGFLSNG